VQRRGQRSGILVDPDRVRQARLDAGLSLAEVAGEDVSRTHIHLIEHGRSRPSRRVIELIAERTGRPVRYFVVSARPASALDDSLARQLSGVATRVRRFVAGNRLTKQEREAMKLVELVLCQAAVFTRSLEAGHGKS
jgi:transcriptional regulator with XRE-family HTH domain